MKIKYVISFERDGGGGYVTRVPDFGITSGGRDFNEAHEMTTTEIKMLLFYGLQRGDQIPSPTPISEISICPGQIGAEIEIDTDEYTVDLV